MKRRVVILFLTVLWAAMVMAADIADTATGIFHPLFRTLQVEVEGAPYAPDVIMLDDPSDRIIISFDELSDDRRYMRYELIHCDRNWRPEGLVDSEFLVGFNQADVDTWAFSDASLVHYVHYTIQVPNEQMQITRSGNYLLRVYDESNPDETLLQARFGVSEASMRAGAEVSSRTDIDTNMTHQQVNVTVDCRECRINDYFSDVTVKVTQNGRLDNEVSVNRPLRVASGKLMFEHNRDLIFDAGNEYRRFETVSTRFPGMRVGEIVYRGPVYNMVLIPDEPRAGTDYLYDSTQHGRFLVREYDSTDSDTGADYVMTHFSLEIPRREDFDIFLDGDFICRRFGPESRMVWNNATGRYEASILLKQGAYNYQYLAVPTGSRRGLTGPVEGDYYETVNEYEVRIYYRVPGERFDRLAAVTTVTSGR